MEIKKIVRGTTEKVEEPKAEENRAEELNTEESKNEVPKAEESKAENVFDGKALLESLREGYGQMQRTTDRFLNGYFKSYSKKPEANTSLENDRKKEKEQASLIIEDYKYLMEQKVAFECSFDVRRPDNSYMTISDGVVIIMERPNSRSVGKNADHVIGKKFKVVVKDIDAKNNIVYVETVEHVDSTQLRLKDCIDMELNKGKKVLVTGRVVAIYPRVVLVDIFDKGLTGGCFIVNWRKGYVRNLEAECKIGEYYDFYIVDKAIVKGKERYQLDRKDLVKDEWDVLAENKMLLEILENKGTIVLQCIQLPEGKTYWWGVSETIKGIEIMCDYTTSLGKIQFGEYYLCKVDKFDLEKRIIRCTPYAKAQSNVKNTATEVARRVREQLKEKNV